MPINNTVFIITVSTLFLHIVDDFYLQGILANMKQREWWEEHYNDKLYRHDYIVALLIHSMSWSFMIHLPTLVYLYMAGHDLNFFSLSLLLHALLHSLIDNAKANDHSINLITDQLMHVGQIITALITCLTL